MELIAIQEKIEDNKEFTDNPLCKDTIFMCLDFYKKIGFKPPWICYYAAQDGKLIGSAAFKGKPTNGMVEIAYGVMEPYRQRGLATEICKTLVELALKTDPGVRVTARTLPENNYSTRVLQKNNFILLGTVDDPEDGPVWEWEYQSAH